MDEFIGIALIVYIIGILVIVSIGVTIETMEKPESAPDHSIGMGLIFTVAMLWPVIFVCVAISCFMEIIDA